MIEALKKNWLFTLLLIDICFIILYPKFPLINVSGTYVAIRIEDILIALTLGLWLFNNLKNAWKLLSKSITQSFILFWIAGFISILAGVYAAYEVTPHLGFLHWIRRIEVMGLFFVAATTIKNQLQVKLILKTLIVVNLIVVLYGFGQIFLDFPVISTTNREFSKGLILKLTPGARPNSTFAGHYDLAVYLSMILTFLGAYFFYFEGKKNSLKNYLQKGLMFVSGIGSFILLAFTAARLSFVATLGSLVIVLWLTGKKLLIIGLIVLSLFAVAVVPELRHRLVATITVNLIGGGGPKYSPPPGKVNIFTPENQTSVASKAAVIKETIEATKSGTASATEATVSADIAPGEPINTTELGVYRSFNIRTDVEWPRALRAFSKNPVSGTGYSSLTIATDNDFLRSLGETGLLGTLSLILIFWIIIKTYLKNLKNLGNFEKLFIISVIGSILAVLTTGLFIDVLEASKVATFFWFILGVGWAVVKGYKEEI